MDGAAHRFIVIGKQFDCCQHFRCSQAKRKKRESNSVEIKFHEQE